MTSVLLSLFHILTLISLQAILQYSHFYYFTLWINNWGAQGLISMVVFTIMPLFFLDVFSLPNFKHIPDSIFPDYCLQTEKLHLIFTLPSCLNMYYRWSWNWQQMVVGQQPIFSLSFSCISSFYYPVLTPHIYPMRIIFQKF